MHHQQLHATFYVAPTGKDSNPGTFSKPFATLSRARDAVRGKIAAGLSEDVLVQIHGGNYVQTQALTFTPDDSGTEKYAITYAAAAGETVALNGGRPITGWMKGPGAVWSTHLAQVQGGQWYFRQLFVNGKRATRARTPNADDWWHITSSTANKEQPPAEDAPIHVKVSGPIKAWSNPSDIEMVYMQNNECGRKRLSIIDATGQSVTLATPNRWNPREFICDWMLSIPFAGKPCYFENALEMLDQPGEWYLDRQSGILHYWPRPGEDMTRAEVVAPVAQNTLLAVEGNHDHPVVNVHFQGLHVCYVDWTMPPWGYMPMFCCNVGVMQGAKPGHRPIEAAVEFSFAQSCSFSDGGVTDVGGMGLCLREGTSYISITGNEIANIGGGGIAAGWTNCGAGFLDAALPPAPDEFSDYRIENNYIHHCGSDLFGAVGILLMACRRAVVTHNLIHDTAYFGIGVAGNQDAKVTYSGDNLIAYNLIYDAMTTTIDGAAIYITFAHHGQGTCLRGNVIYDTHGNPHHEHWGAHPPSAGMYLDGNCQGCRYEYNVLYHNLAAGPLIFNYDGARSKNEWLDNNLVKDALPPAAYLHAVQTLAGLEPTYQQRLLNAKPNRCEFHLLGKFGDAASWSAYQYHLPDENQSVIQIIQRRPDEQQALHLNLTNMLPADHYALKAYIGSITDSNVWGPGTMPFIDDVELVDLAKLGLPAQVSGQALLDTGLTLQLGASPQVIWVVYTSVTIGL